MFFIIDNKIVLSLKNISLFFYLQISRNIYENIENHPRTTNKQMSFMHVLLYCFDYLIQVETPSGTLTQPVGVVFERNKQTRRCHFRLLSNIYNICLWQWYLF